jgi:hypothetical protein
VTETNRPRLERICKKLGVSEIDFLWAPNLKPRPRTHIYNDAEAESVIYQLRQLLQDDFRQNKFVEKICTAIEVAFNSLVCGIKDPKERARGGSFVDNDISRKIVRRNRRLGDGRKKKEDD